MALSPSSPGGKEEVSSLPSGSSGSTNRDDLSAGQTADVSGLIEQDIADRKLLRTFQKFAFWGAFAVIFVTFVGLFLWLWLIHLHVTDANVITTYRVSFFIAPVIVLATLGALLTLALLKLAFRSNDKKDEEPSFVSMFQALAAQAMEIWKGGKKAD